MEYHFTCANCDRVVCGTEHSLDGPDNCPTRTMSDTLDEVKSEIDKIEFPEIKTKQVVSLVQNLELQGKKCLVVDEGENNNLVLSCRNIPEVAYSRASVTSGYAFLNAEYVLMTRAALDKVQEVFA